MERLDKFISSRTDYSRSEIKKLLRDGKILVGDSVQKDGGVKIDQKSGRVTICGEEISSEEKVYIVMNKPLGVVCATEDRQERTVLDILPEKLMRKGLFPAGRLDKDTSGMVLITNDGKLSHRILSPKRHIPKYYLAKISTDFCEKYAKEFEKGIVLANGERCLPAKAKGFEDLPNAVFIELFEGKYHQVRRMFAAVESHVESLVRIRMGGLSMPENMRAGDCMELLHKDVEKLLETEDFERVYNRFIPFFSSYWINKL